MNDERAGKSFYWAVGGEWVGCGKKRKKFFPGFGSGDRSHIFFLLFFYILFFIVFLLFFIYFFICIIYFAC